MTRYIKGSAIAAALTCAGYSADFLSGGVASANARAVTPNIVASGFALNLIAQGSDPLENPSGIFTEFGFLSTGVKTEPDQNVYLALDHNPGGPSEGYDYGRHFLFQGHENSPNAYITRINLDVTDAAHRITMLTTPDQNANFGSIDGSAYDPFTQTLLFSQEGGVVGGGLIEVSRDWNNAGNAHTLYGIIGHGGFEGIRVDDRGVIYLAEDSGGTGVSADINNPTATVKPAKNPNSYIYRFIPTDIHNLSAGGKLQALQVVMNGAPVKFVPVDAGHPFGAAFSTVQLFLHTPNTHWPVRWVTVHDTAVNGTTEFNANTLARAAGATPFKRPENIDFLPGSGFQTFFFTPTGDTDTRSGNVPALAARGAWGSIFRVDLDSSRDKGILSLFFLGDSVHNSFDNLTFGTDHVLLVAEDRGDTLHGQLNTLDSVWAFDVNNPASAPVRFLALGEDDLAFGVEDNEPTGFFVSDGDTTAPLRTTAPGAGTRAFFTQQHGKNQVYEIVTSTEVQTTGN